MCEHRGSSGFVPVPVCVPVPELEDEDEEEDEDEREAWWGRGGELIPNT
jgi:hypothetical protein